MTEAVETPQKKHIGKNIQKIRVYLGVKQDALASDVGMSQQAISKIEQEEEIEEDVLSKIANALGVTPELVRTFDEENAVYNINNHNYKDATINEGATPIVQQINPVEKIIELYERLLKSEREKIEILQKSK